MLWHFLIEATYGTWRNFIAVLFDTLLELFYRRRGSTFDIFINQPHTVSIMLISGEYGGHCMWWKGCFDIHATLFYQYEGVGGALSPWNTKITEVYEIYLELTGEVLAHDIHIIFLVYDLQQMTKMTFSSLLFVLEFMVRNVTAFYSGC